VSAPLKALLGRLPASTQIVGDAGVAVESIEIDSRHVRPGSLFVALQGVQADGHDYLNEAVAAGAGVVVLDVVKRTTMYPGVTKVYVPDTRRALSAISSAFYGDPSKALSVVGVTGTNGKTTTTRMISWILQSAGQSCGTIGTIGADFGGQTWPLANTTPLANQLQCLLGKMRDLGAKTVAMEVSSHALALDRVEDIHFAIGVLTNVTRDHLDFHGTMEAYAAAKHRLFGFSQSAVINVDDAYGAMWAPEIRRRMPTVTYALRGNADLVPRDLEIHLRHCTFGLDGRLFIVPMFGDFNAANALAAIAVARKLGVSDEQSARALEKLPVVSGRMEYVGDGIVEVVVDYAHTPDALESALKSLRAEVDSKLVVVFGCGGDRDAGKRPEMGEIAARYADRIVVTNDNPRSEDPQKIVDEIVGGIGAHPYDVVLDRREAIERAIFEAEPGDVVLVAGKGHEKYQIVAGVTQPFDDVETARLALRSRRLRK
jgi:UDP-N-acetylmuramoyl-L-alanyl-D-glutamate--2,6-diaminopimelate ligase